MTTILPFPPQDPPVLPAWPCHCGKRSVLGRCWNCRQPRPAGDGAEDSGAVDGGGAECYDPSTLTPCASIEGKPGAQSGPDRVEAVATAFVALGPFVGRSISTPLLGASNQGASLGLIGRSLNGPMAFKGVWA